ncbi:hypothetical protein HR16_06985 [Porphyromonas gulae]|nr:hypothetical protein HR16_06985 [Porphyromonas gulae]
MLAATNFASEIYSRKLAVSNFSTEKAFCNLQQVISPPKFHVASLQQAIFPTKLYAASLQP